MNSIEKGRRKMATAKRLTLSKMIKRLQELEAEGWGRAYVSVNKDTLDDGNGTFNACDVLTVEGLHINIVDGDGFHIENKDGSERMSATVMLNGRWYDNPLRPQSPKVHNLLTEMRQYVIHHGVCINECVAWNQLKQMFNVDESQGA